MENFINIFREILDNRSLFKLSISKPRSKESEFTNVNVRPTIISDQLVYTATLREKTRDITKNYTKDELLTVATKWLEDSFFNADLYLDEEKITLLQSKKGKATVLRKKEKSTLTVGGHDRQKSRLIREDLPFLHDLGITSVQGNVLGVSSDKFKQINRFVEIISDLIGSSNDINKIIDMGCGKGYLTFGLYSYLSMVSNPNVHVLGVELRPDLVQKCNSIAQKYEMHGLSFDKGSIDDYRISEVDMVVALHACDIATDMAIAKGIESNAKYIIVAPCCHKQIRREMVQTADPLDLVIRHGIFKERMAEMITDTIRALILESKGYQVKVFEFISTEHTGKNIMITAHRTGKPSQEPLDKVARLKSTFGISHHYLEGIV